MHGKVKKKETLTPKNNHPEYIKIKNLRTIILMTWKMP